MAPIFHVPFPSAIPQSPAVDVPPAKLAFGRPTYLWKMLIYRWFTYETW